LPIFSKEKHLKVQSLKCFLANSSGGGQISDGSSGTGRTNPGHGLMLKVLEVGKNGKRLLCSDPGWHKK